MSWRYFSVLVLGIGSGLSLRADDLETQRQLQAVKSQRVSGQVQLLLTQARVWEKNQPEKARDLLKEAKKTLEEDTLLAEGERKELLNQVNARIRDVGLVRQNQAEEAVNAQKASDRLKYENQAAQNPPPNGTFQTAKNQFQGATSSLDTQRNLYTQKNQGINGVLNSVRESAIPTDKDFKMPPPELWARISERGKQKLTSQESNLIKALNSTLAPSFENTRLKEALNYLMEKTGITILVDEGSLKELMIDYDNDAVNFKTNFKISLRTVLRKILNDRGLNYTIREGNLHVMTIQKAREQMVVKTYPIGDLVAVNPIQYGIFTQQVMMQNAQAIVNMIQNQVDPNHWDANNGPGRVTFEPRSMSLIVRASAETHYMLGNNLR